MQQFLRFANLQLLLILVPIVFLVIIARVLWYRHAVYRYSLGEQLQKNRLTSRHKHRALFFMLRVLLLLGLVFFIGRPQLVDPRSKIVVEGIDMMLVLDISGSMQFQDYGDQNQSRVESAKQEAIRFIEKREQDPMGLVLFGKDAVSRCPITADKNILKEIIKKVKIGVVDPDGTVLSLAMLTAANRLKNSESKSKIMIVLTDGEPSRHDQRPEVAIEVAKRMGIKVYTIGIGSGDSKIVSHPLYGIVQRPGVNTKLLKTIAQETGGEFFLAENQDEMRRIYDEIDKLETTAYETDIFSNYKEVFLPFVWILIAFILIEIAFSTLIWFGI